MRAFFAILSAAILLTGCSVVSEVRDQRYSRNNKNAERWLSDQFGDAEINVSGRWLSTDWGHGTLHQSGRNVTGSLGGYDVRGVVSGTRVYLLIADGDWYYYSAILEMSRPGLLTGRFSRAIPFVKTFGRPMRLEMLAH